MLNWQRPYDNNKSLDFTSYRLHTTAETKHMGTFRQVCVLRLPSSKGKAGILPCAHDVQTDQECRASQISNREAVLRCEAYRVAPIPITETAV